MTRDEKLDIIIAEINIAEPVAGLVMDMFPVESSTDDAKIISDIITNKINSVVKEELNVSLSSEDELDIALAYYTNPVSKKFEKAVTKAVKLQLRPTDLFTEVLMDPDCPDEVRNRVVINTLKGFSQYAKNTEPKSTAETLETLDSIMDCDGKCEECEGHGDSNEDDTLLEIPTSKKKPDKGPGGEWLN